jgi:YrbI family 3-deoxy-D-manno-octulosonate 8-phosphate phosphatase
MKNKTSFKLRPKDIDLIVFDFDGVFTDNKVITFQDGREAVLCSRSDGMGIETLRKLGLKMFILSTETNIVVSARAQKLKLTAHIGCGDKVTFLKEYFQKEGMDGSRAIYVGNDMNDYGAMKLVKYPMCPLDAHPEIKKIAYHVFSKNGGDGAIRELADLLNRGEKS